MIQPITFLKRLILTGEPGILGNQVGWALPIILIFKKANDELWSDWC